LVIVGQISEPQPLSPIQERSLVESPPSAALLSTGTIYSFSFSPYTMYFCFLHIWLIYSDHGNRGFEDTREYITDEPEEEVDYEPSPDHAFIEELMEEADDDVMKDPFKEPDEIIEDPIIQGTSFFFLCSSIIPPFIVFSHFFYCRVAHPFR